MYAVPHPMHSGDIDASCSFSEGSGKSSCICRRCLCSHEGPVPSFYLGHFQCSHIVWGRDTDKAFQCLNDALRYKCEVAVSTPYSARCYAYTDIGTHETSTTRICKLKISSSNLSHFSVSFSKAVFSRCGEGCKYSGRGIRPSK